MKRALVPLLAMLAAALFVLSTPSPSSAQQPTIEEPSIEEPSIEEPSNGGQADLSVGSSQKSVGLDVSAAPGAEAIFVESFAELRDADLPRWAKYDLLFEHGHVPAFDIFDKNLPAFNWGSLSSSELTTKFDPPVAFSMDQIAKINDIIAAGKAGADLSGKSADPGDEIIGQKALFGLCRSTWQHKTRSVGSSGANGDLFKPVNRPLDLGNGFKATYSASANLDGKVKLNAKIFYKQKETCFGLPFKWEFKHADVDIVIVANGTLDVQNELTIEHAARLWQKTLKLGDLKTGFTIYKIFRVDFEAYLNLDLALDISSSYTISKATKINQDYDLNGRYEAYLRCTKSGCNDRKESYSDFSFDAVDRPQTYTQQTVDIVLTPSADLYAGLDVDVSLLGLIGDNLFRGRAGIVAEMPMRLYWTKGNNCSDANFDGLNEQVQGTIFDVNVQLRAYTELKLFNEATRNWLNMKVPTGWLRGLVNINDRLNFPLAKSIHRNLYMRVLQQGTYSPLDPVVVNAGLFPVSGGAKFEGIELGGVRDCYPFRAAGIIAEVNWGDGQVTRHNVGGGVGPIAHDWADDGRNRTVKVRWISDASGRTINGPWTTVQIDGNSNQPAPKLFVPRVIVTGDKSGPVLQWNGSKDADGYKIFFNNRLVATVTETSWSPASTGSGWYRVSAFHRASNTATAKSKSVQYTVPVSGGGGGNSGVELISDRDPSAGNFRTYALIGGARQYLDGACSKSLMGMGVPFTKTAWKEISAYPLLSPRQNCAQVTALVQSGGGGGNSGKPEAAVSMGDSFISGEGGRWLGNAKSPVGTFANTDLGAGTYLGASAANGCHRSDAAPIFSANISGLIPLNIACSGALASHVTGNSFKGEPAQTKQLAELTKTYDVDLIVLSVGGNDMGFATLMSDCVATYLAQGPICKDSRLDRKITNTVMPAVDRAVKRIKSTMTAAGDTDYRLVLQSYPSPVPAASGIQFGQGSVHLGGARAKNGCAFYDTDLNWARNEVVPKLDAEFRKVAAANNIEFLSLKDAFDGKEVCAKRTIQATDNNLATGGGMTGKLEWIRFASVPGLIQGDVNESFHPNAIGQEAMGRCLSLTWDRSNAKVHTCKRGGSTPAAMRVS